MYEYKIAYRYTNTNEVEGFLGIGSTEETARKDAREQIERKLDIICEEFNLKNLITKFTGLNKEESEIIKNDWKKNNRY
ncbi:MAG TPA: hypothetical protein DEG71_06295 [Clostridiales bacterium]|nr:hypothetical protein [Clostridiales bacterium]